MGMLCGKVTVLYMKRDIVLFESIFKLLKVFIVKFSATSKHVFKRNTNDIPKEDTMEPYKIFN